MCMCADKLILRCRSRVLWGLPFFQEFWSFTYCLIFSGSCPHIPPWPKPRRSYRGKFLGCIRPVLDLIYIRPMSHKAMCCLFLKKKTFLAHWKHQTLNLISCVILGKSLNLSEFRAFYPGS